MPEPAGEQVVVIPAHGLGTRIRELTGGRPKTLLEVGGQPLLARLLTAVSRTAGARAIVYVQPDDTSVAGFLETARFACPVEIRRRAPAGYVHDVLAVSREVGDVLSILDSDLVVPLGELSRFLRQAPSWQPELELVAGVVPAAPVSDGRTIRLADLGEGVAKVIEEGPADLQFTGAYHWRPLALRRMAETVAAGTASFHAHMAGLARLGHRLGCLPFSVALNVNTAADLAAAQAQVTRWQAEGLE
jgi:GTP:adenosylcobinamide-phosphate guanylyltransferase